MKKYVNGKILEMTEADIERSKARASAHKARTDSSVYEKRIKDLEQMVEKLVAEKESKENPEE